MDALYDLQALLPLDESLLVAFALSMAEPRLERRFFDMLMESQYWPASQLIAHQRSQLGQLLRHARANVPFYAKRLDVLFRADGSIDWDRWSEVPILKRKDLAENGAALHATTYPASHGPASVVRSSGSTGVPITVSVNVLTVIVNGCLRWRMHRWHDLDWSQLMISRMGDNRGPENWPGGTFKGQWGPPWDQPATRGEFWVFNSRIPVETLIDVLIERDCKYLISGPKVGHILALEALRLGKAPRLDAILMQSGALTSDDRAICRDVFGARLIEHYSSKEGGQMAHECECGHLHINAEAALVEILDEDGYPATPGTQGRVVITPFYSTAQPLIRYEQGDIIVPGDACDCGRTLPTIQAIVGRTLAIFRHPDGRSVVQIMPEASRKTLQCEFWQLAQVGPLEFEIRYVPKDWSSFGDEGGFAEEFRRIYFADAAVRFKRVREIPLTSAGKQLEYVNEFSGRAS